MNNNNQEAISLMKDWVTDYIIHFQLCPFAKPSFDSDEIDWLFINSPTKQDIIETILEKVGLLQSNSSKTNCLIGVDGYENFEEFWSLAQDIEDLLEDNDLIEDVQLATFHPDYHFANEPKEWGLSNQSPFPIFHLLSQDAVSKGLEKFPQGATWFERNQQFIKNNTNELRKKINSIR